MCGNVDFVLGIYKTWREIIHIKNRLRRHCVSLCLYAKNLVKAYSYWLHCKYLLRFMLGAILFHYKTLTFVQFLLFVVLFWYWICNFLFMLVSLCSSHWEKWDNVTHVIQLPCKKSRFSLRTFSSLSRRDQSLPMPNLTFIKFMFLNLVNQKVSHLAPGYPNMTILDNIQYQHCLYIYDVQNKMYYLQARLIQSFQTKKS